MNETAEVQEIPSHTEAPPDPEERAIELTRKCYEHVTVGALRDFYINPVKLAGLADDEKALVRRYGGIFEEWSTTVGVTTRECCVIDAASHLQQIAQGRDPEEMREKLEAAVVERMGRHTGTAAPAADQVPGFDRIEEVTRRSPTARAERPLLDDLTRTQAYDISYFGFCPECRRPPTGGGNVHSTHLQWCDDCRTWWTFGANLFSNWRDETEEEWEENWRKLTDGGYREVKPAGGEDIPLTPEELRQELQRVMEDGHGSVLLTPSEETAEVRRLHIAAHKLMAALQGIAFELDSGAPGSRERAAGLAHAAEAEWWNPSDPDTDVPF